MERDTSRFQRAHWYIPVWHRLKIALRRGPSPNFQRPYTQWRLGFHPTMSWSGSGRGRSSLSRRSTRQHAQAVVSRAWSRVECLGRAISIFKALVGSESGGLRLHPFVLQLTAPTSALRESALPERLPPWPRGRIRCLCIDLLLLLRRLLVPLRHVLLVLLIVQRLLHGRNRIPAESTPTIQLREVIRPDFLLRPTEDLALYHSSHRMVQ